MMGWGNLKSIVISMHKVPFHLSSLYICHVIVQIHRLLVVKF